MLSIHILCKKYFHHTCINFQYKLLRCYDYQSLALIRSVMALPTLDLLMSFMWKQMLSESVLKLIATEFVRCLEFSCGQRERN